MNLLLWKSLHPAFRLEMLGYIPQFLREDDSRPAKDQINERYIGSWEPFRGFKLTEAKSLLYPGDPPMRPLAKAQFRSETLYFYPHAWFLILQEDGSWECARLD